MTGMAHGTLAVSDMGTTTNTRQDTHVPVLRQLARL